MSALRRFPGFRLRPTRWGVAYVVAILVIGAAAVNTGNNALMAILGLALGAYVVSGTWSRQVLGRVEVEVVPPREAFAGTAVQVEVRLSNRSRLFPAYGLVVRDGDGAVVLTEPLLRAGERRRSSVTLRFPRRGWAELEGWRLEVLLPLGFFLKSKQATPGFRLLVYPELLPASTVADRQGGGRRTAEIMAAHGREGEVTQLRGYRLGDDHRQLHWKQTARQQRPIVMERQRQGEAPAYLVLDHRVEDPEDVETRARFEREVSEVATAAVQRYRAGRSVGLVVGTQVVPPLRAPAGLGRLLAPLAEVQPVRCDLSPSPAVPDRRAVPA